MEPIIDTTKILESIPETRLNERYRFIDGDTLRDEDTGKSIRIQGYDVPETFKPRDPNKEFDAAGSQAHAELARLAREKGFSEVQISGQQDKYNRELGDLYNPQTGERFSHYVLENGLGDLAWFSDDSHKQAKAVGVSKQLYGEKRLADEDEAFTNIMAANGGSFDWKTLADTEQEYDSDIHYGTGIRRLNRTIDNKAMKQFSTSFDTALMGVAESYYGFKQMVGAVMGNTEIERSGSIGVAAQRGKMQNQPKVTIDISDVDGIGDFVDYTANNAAMSIPYMANTIMAAGAGSVAGAAIGGPVGAVVGGVVGLASPTAIYAGQVYNGQDEKNAKVAFTSGLAQATLDRLGLKGITTGGKSLKGILGEAEAKLIAKGMSRKAAQEKVVAASKRELAGFFDDGLAMAAKQLTARNTTRTILNRAAKGLGSEAVTEAAQESLAQIGEQYDEDNFGIFDHDGFNDEFLNRITNAAVAGGTLGGAFGGAGGIREVGGWADVKHQLGKPKDAFEDGLAQKEEGGGTIEQRMNRMQRDDQDTKDIAIRTSDYRDSKAAKSFDEKALETITKVPFLWRGMMRARADKDSQHRSPAYRLLVGMMGGHLGRVFSGANYEEDAAMGLLKHKKHVGMEDKHWYQGFNGIRNDGKAREAFNKKREKVNADYLNWFENNHNRKTGEINPNAEYDWSQWDGDTIMHKDLISKDAMKNVWQELAEAQNNMSQSMLASQNFWWMKNTKKGEKATPKFRNLNNYLMKFKAMRKDEVGKQRGKFEQLIRSEYGMSASQATELATRILEKEPLDGIDDNVFNLLHQGVPATAAKKRTMALSENPKFKEFFHSDMFHNQHEAARSAARFETYHKMIGKDNWRLAKLLDDAQSDGVPKNIVDELSMGVQSYLEAQSGNYKRPAPGSWGERALGVQKFALTWSLLTALPLSALSSTVELALVTRALTNEQIFGRKGSLSEMGLQLSKMIGRGTIRVGHQLWSGQEYIPDSLEQRTLARLGFNQQETGAATTVGATETSDWARNRIDRFFQYNGLQGLTNTTRSIRASQFTDATNAYIDTIFNGEPDTEEVRYAREQLRNLGLDVDVYMDLMTTPESAMSEKMANDLSKMEDLAMYTWVNQAVALPGAANRPLFYQDPRLFLFTQFNGYIATFTANHLPQLWSQYIGRGKPSLKFNTFAMMVTMIFLGYASQYLKDWLKYGEPTTYLNSNEKLRRAVNSSGMLGQGERALNFIWPTFERQASNPVEAIAGMAFDEMPAMSPLERIYKSADAFYEGDTQKGKYNAMRAAPVIGPLQGLAKWATGVEY